MKAAVDFGLQQLRSIVLKPRLNTWIDQFTSYNHILNEVKILALNGYGPCRTRDMGTDS